MRSALIVLLSALPALADAQHPTKVPQRVAATARIESASVLFGPGIIPDRTGETPAPAFKTNLSGEVRVEGLPSHVKPRFRFWLVKAGQEEKLRTASPPSAHAKALDFTPTLKREGGGIGFSISWSKGTVEDQDRLFVEVFSGRRRVATAISAIQSLYLPASHPRGGEVKD